MLAGRRSVDIQRLVATLPALVDFRALRSARKAQCGGEPLSAGMIADHDVIHFREYFQHAMGTRAPKGRRRRGSPVFPMIEDERQHRITKGWAAKFEDSLREVLTKPDTDPLYQRILRDSFESEIEVLRCQIAAYEAAHGSPAQVPAPAETTGS
jgi:hypothetical protein